MGPTDPRAHEIYTGLVGAGIGLVLCRPARRIARRGATAAVVVAALGLHALKDAKALDRELLELVHPLGPGGQLVVIISAPLLTVAIGALAHRWALDLTRRHRPGAAISTERTVVSALGGSAAPA